MAKTNKYNFQPGKSGTKREKEGSVTNIPNSYTKAAMDELNNGKGKYFKSVDGLFKSL